MATTRQTRLLEFFSSLGRCYQSRKSFRLFIKSSARTRESPECYFASKVWVSHQKYIAGAISGGSLLLPSLSS
jgi:hypothetical protein